jgi:hypothetical protein
MARREDSNPHELFLFAAAVAAAAAVFLAAVDRRHAVADPDLATAATTSSPGPALSQPTDDQATARRSHQPRAAY